MENAKTTIKSLNVAEDSKLCIT